MEWLKKAPTPLIVTVLVVVGAVTIAYVGGYVILTVNGVDTADYRGLLNTGMNYILVLLGAGSTVASVSAARSASKAEDQTNGQLTARDQHIAELQGQIQRAGLRPVPPPDHEN